MRRVAALALITVAILAHASMATVKSGRPPSLAEIVSLTHFAFVGTVDSLSYRHDRGIVTDVRFRDVRFARGFPRPSPLVLTVIGGTMDGHGQGIVGAPVFVPGIRYVILAGDLGRRETLYMPIVGMTDGLFYVDRDSTTNRSVVRDSEHRAIKGAAGISEDDFLREIELISRAQQE
jgi:hypothetical protein